MKIGPVAPPPSGVPLKASAPVSSSWPASMVMITAPVLSTRASEPSVLMLSCSCGAPR
jgi:hypothetical protein